MLHTSIVVLVSWYRGIVHDTTSTDSRAETPWGLGMHSPLPVPRKAPLQVPPNRESEIHLSSGYLTLDSKTGTMTAATQLR